MIRPLVTYSPVILSLKYAILRIVPLILLVQMNPMRSLLGPSHPDIYFNS